MKAIPTFILLIVILGCTKYNVYPTSKEDDGFVIRRLRIQPIYRFKDYTADGKKVVGLNLRRVDEVAKKGCFTFDDISTLQDGYRKLDLKKLENIDIYPVVIDTFSCVGIYYFINQDFSTHNHLFKILKFNDKIVTSMNKDSDGLSKDYDEFESKYKILFKEHRLDSIKMIYLKGSESNFHWK